MTQERIQGKFYPLQHEEWLKACKELTPAQKDVLYFIRTLDPYGHGVDLSVSGIAKQLSTQDKEVHRSTVSRALKALDEKGFIDLELLRVKVMVLGKGVHCCDETTVLPTDNSVASTQQARSPRNKRDRDATDVIVTQQTRSPRNNQGSEPLPNEDFSSPKTIKTYSEFIKTLSESERENFLKFCLELTSNLSSPVNDIEAWLAHKNKAGQNRWEVYYQKFSVWQEKQTKKYSSSRSSQMMKKFQEEIEQQQQQAIETWVGTAVKE